MLKIESLDPEVLETLREMSRSDDDIESMSPEQAFSEYCNWHGLINWGNRLLRVADNIRAAQE